jgi:hypothetical protein
MFEVAIILSAGSGDSLDHCFWESQNVGKTQCETQCEMHVDELLNLFVNQNTVA